jgi:hypothetical protein
MKSQHVYVVLEVATGIIIMVYRNREDIDDEYYSYEYSIQHIYFWK